MRFVAALILTSMLAWALGLFLPFWSLSLSAMVIGFLVHPGGWKALLAGLLAGALLWGGLAWRIDVSNAHILSGRLEELFGVGVIGMAWITAALGALLAGLGLLLGDRIRHAVS